MLKKLQIVLGLVAVMMVGRAYAADEAQQPKKVPLTDAAELAKILPSKVEGWKFEKPETMKMENGTGGLSMATMTGTKKMGDKKDDLNVSISLQDTAYSDIYKKQSAMPKLNMETKEGSTKTTTYRDHPALETIQKTEKQVNYMIMANGFIIVVSVTGTDDTQEAKNILDAFQWDTIEKRTE